ncbi:hypothetical protein ACXJJ3_18470 [Kribbella sp. WER1]
MPTDYGAGAIGAQTVEQLQAVMNDIAAKAQADAGLRPSLQQAAEMWQASYDTLNNTAQTFRAANNKLMSNWLSPAPVAVYKDAAEASTNSLTNAATAIIGGAGGGESIPVMLTGLATYIGQVATATAAAKEALDKAVETFSQDVGAQLLEKLFVDINRPTVVQAGAQLSALAAEYERVGPQIVGSAQSMQWKGPGAGNTLPAGTPAGSGNQGGSPGGGQGGQQGGQGDQQGGAGQDQQGGDQAGQQGDQQGGQSGGDQQGQVPGSDVPGSQVPGSQVPGTGLAGLPTLPKAPLVPPSLEQFAPPNVPMTPTTPAASLPVGGLPLPGVGGGRGIGGGGLGGGLGGGIGGGVGGGIGHGKSDLPKAGVVGLNGDKQIARAGEQLTPQSAPTGGRAPGSPTGSGLAGTPGSGAGGGGGVPPMMPPGAGAAGMGGGGRSSTSGTAGTIRPAARKRDRQSEETPGVPTGLRGKAGKDLPGAFPVAPANTRRRQEKAPVETLQLLDEDLWKVEDTDTAPQRHYAN